MKKFFLLIVVTICCLSCSEDDINEIEVEGQNGQNDTTFQENLGQSKNADFIGKIVNSEGEILIDVQVTIGDILTVTDHNGVFVINDVPVFEKFAFISAVKDGYLKGSRAIVPTTNSTNDIQITLLEKNRIETVNSGEESSVPLGNSKVIFSGDFVDSNNNPYTGQVEVSVHYLEPNKEDTFTKMPGMLFGQASDNDAVALETYGMLAVNLFSPSGEALNVTQANPATIEFPVDRQQTAIAPETINLWYFDDTVGYWKEEGIATKVGNKYIAEISHFSWWNINLPIDYINACFTIQTINDVIPNSLVRILRTEPNQVIFYGYTNEVGEECGLIPANEEVIIQVYGANDCSNEVIHEEIVGPFSNDTSFSVTVLDNSFQQATITANLNTCDGTPITNGYAIIYYNNGSAFNNSQIISITDGLLNYNLTYCDPSAYSISVFDLDSGENTGVIPLNLTVGITELGTFLSCEETLGTYIGFVKLETQEEVNTFGAFGYTKIIGQLLLGEEYINNDITDLTPLSSLTAIFSNSDGINSGRLKVYTNNITSLEGLHNITTINGFVLSTAHSLTDLTGLENLTTVGNSERDFKTFIIKSNASLQSLDGLGNLETIGVDSDDISTYMSIVGNPELQNIDALSNLTTVYGQISIGENAVLQNLNGLSNLTAVHGPLSIVVQCDIGGEPFGTCGNPLLSDLCGLQNLFTNGIFGEVRIELNAYNPTVQDIIDGNCAQ